VTAILAANDIRDLKEDQAAGKRTIVTKFGRRFAQWEFLFLLAAAFSIVIVLVLTTSLVSSALLSLLAIPQVILALRFIWREQNRQKLVRGLQASSRLHWYFGVLLAHKDS
jgi:1,4-dihydroxy-2-naphthoate octaprenyltransferase